MTNKTFFKSRKDSLFSISIIGIACFLIGIDVYSIILYQGHESGQGALAQYFTCRCWINIVDVFPNELQPVKRRWELVIHVVLSKEK